MLLEQGGVIDDDEVHGLGGADGGGTGAVADQLDLPEELTGSARDHVRSVQRDVHGPGVSLT